MSLRVPDYETFLLPMTLTSAFGGSLCSLL